MEQYLDSGGVIDFLFIVSIAGSIESESVTNDPHASLLFFLGFQCP